MTRKLVPQEIEKLKVPFRSEYVIIYLDRNDRKFFAVHQGVETRDASFDVVKYRMVEEMKRVKDLVWFPVIELTSETYNRHTFSYSSRQILYGRLEMSLDRYYGAISEKKTLLRTDFDTSPETRSMDNHLWYPKGLDRNSMPKFSLPWHEDNVHYMAYTEELWTGLAQLVGNINSLREKLNIYLMSQDSYTRIEQVGAAVLGNLLESGNETK